MPLTSKEKQAAFRFRNADLGLSELRGIWTTVDEEIWLKPKIRELLKQTRGNKIG